jgi:hypothetical protein
MKSNSRIVEAIKLNSSNEAIGFYSNCFSYLCFLEFTLCKLKFVYRIHNFQESYFYLLLVRVVDNTIILYMIAYQLLNLLYSSSYITNYIFRRSPFLIPTIYTSSLNTIPLSMVIVLSLPSINVYILPFFM